MIQKSKRVEAFGTTIFHEINLLAAEYGAVNLGQGKPDFDGPEPVIEGAVAALRDSAHNQYADGRGLEALRIAIAQHEDSFYARQLDPDQEIIVTVGATEAIFAAILGLTDPGDEIIVFEPFYDSYVPNILMAGGIPRYCPLHPPAWDFDPDQLRSLFNAKTRAIVVNTPHNPSGKVFSPDELALIAELCLGHDVTIITDEVYEHIVFDEAVHTSMAQIPGVQDRTLRISSLGKTFNVTGWKIGWATGPAELVAGVQRARQFMSFAVAHPLQVGAVQALQLPASYYEALAAMYQAKRDRLVNALQQANLKPATPAGSYFVMADFSAVYEDDDKAFAQWLIREAGVASIPPTVFYSPPNQHIVSKQARFAFCKSDATLDEAAARLQALGQRI
ncbi:MAG: aminotransferase class I/II-fold pyridoxal phosphate-dependent enzyme [Chloroflexi bacterium]|nr:aminotransferase class I/II-fold pyridoxal phosphate-dependent enzyme [Chloroflexota bacterium]